MADHPLTDDICESLIKEFVGLDPDDMRTAADWQLEQDQKELADFLEELSCRGHSRDAISDLMAFVNDFKNYMRPTQENN